MELLKLKALNIYSTFRERFSAVNPYSFLLCVILLFSFLARVYNLNYNSSFNDEATYIVIGRLGIFQGDWWSYNTSAWLAGLPYIYPSITAVVSMIGGVIGSRFLNVIIGVLLTEAIYIFTQILSKQKHPYDYISGLIAAALVGGSTIALYVSRIATYDMPSFYFLFLGLIPLVLAQNKNCNVARCYFYASFLIMLSCLTKIIIFLYLPLIVVYSFYVASKNGKKYLKFWLIYFFAPIFIVTTLYTLANFTSLIAYAKVSINREKVDYGIFFQMFWRSTKYLWIFWIIGAPALIRRRWNLLAILSLCSVWVMIPHLVSQRAHWTFEKQILLTVCFVAPITGIGMGYILKELKNSPLQKFTYAILIVAIGFYWFFSYKEAQSFNSRWANTSDILSHLNQVVQPGDKVLAESGGTALLALYNKNYPTNTTTFDWFSYHKIEGEEAYVNAVKDGYFDYIEIEAEGQQGDDMVKHMRSSIFASMTNTYEEEYTNNGFMIFRRKS